MEKRFKLGVVGCGNMATAIVGGIRGSISPKNIAVYDNDADKRKAFAAKFDVFDAESNDFLAKNCEYVLLAVKPQCFESVAPDLIGVSCLISIMAGVRISSIKSRIPGVKRICRVMPNTPCLCGEGMCALSFDGYTEKDKEFVLNIFNSFAKTVQIEEDKLDAVTAISGSGPAYVFLFIKHLIAAGIEQGLTPEESRILTLQTVKGAEKLVENSTLPIETLINNVCSKGGTTIEAVNCFNEKVGIFGDIISESVSKCKKRSEELSSLL